MASLEDLYQQLIVDHSRNPRNQGELPGATHRAEGYNPLCGDKVTLYLRLDRDRIEEVKFQGSGCAISTASASLLTEAVRGRTAAEAEELFEKFHRLVTGEALSTSERASLGKLAAFAGVSQFPIRVKCASLAWHTLRAALERSAEVVSTE
mgnify:CR=1 FL=1